MKTYGSLTFDQQDGVWVLDAEPHVHIRAKRLFGKLRKQARGKLLLKANPEVCRDLEWFIDRYPMSMDLTSAGLLKAHAKSHRDSLARLEDFINPEYQATVFAMAKAARDYQAREAMILLECGGTLVGDDVGLGKTITAIAAMTDPRALPAIVICQPHLMRQWKEKVHEFAPDLRPHILKSRTPYPLPRFMGATPDVLIGSYYAITHGWAKVLAAYGKFVTFDEVQELRHMTTNRYDAAVEICAGMPYKLGLSATPIFNYGGEIFSVLDLLRPGCLGTLEEFHTEWCSPIGNNKHKLTDPKAFGRWAREQFLIVRHTRKQVGRSLGTDPRRIVEVVDNDEGVLDRVKADAERLAEIVLTKAPLERGVKWQASEQLLVLLRMYTGISKAPFVADFVHMLLADPKADPVVLVGWHRQVYEIWKTKLAEFAPIMYTGSETAAEKAKAVDRFRAGESRVFLLSLRSGAGLDGLQDVSSTMVFGELDYSPGVHEQCIGRLARDGQTHPVFAFFLVANGGSDPILVEINGLKREQKEGIMNPTVDFLERVDDSGEHVQRIAEAYLRSIGRKVPAPVPLLDDAAVPATAEVPPNISF